MAVTSYRALGFLLSHRSCGLGFRVEVLGLRVSDLVKALGLELRAYRESSVPANRLPQERESQGRNHWNCIAGASDGRKGCWVLVKGFNLSYQNKETILFTIDPPYGKLD